MALAVGGVPLVLALVVAFPAALVVTVVVLAALRGADGSRGGARQLGDADGDRDQEEGFREGAHHHERHPFFHIGQRPATPTAPVACASATSERTSSYCARVRLSRAWVSADCDSRRSVVVAAPALSAASVTR